MVQKTSGGTLTWLAHSERRMCSRARLCAKLAAIVGLQLAKHFAVKAVIKTLFQEQACHHSVRKIAAMPFGTDHALSVLSLSRDA